MTLDDFIQTKQEQLSQFEHALEKRALGAGDVLQRQLETLRAKGNELASRLQALKAETHDRIDVIRMGVDSAWDELQTAFQTATARDPNKDVGA